GYLLATDLADYLVGKGMPFRKAHGAVAELARNATSQRKSFQQLGIQEYRRFSPLFGEDVYQVTVEKSVAARDVPGGTAPHRVQQALTEAKRLLESASDP
ncbi:MAG: argininosuccinate lyase, partial [Chloroflexi bacterium]|nr:argininosuccinate lyase [Chloroflexota bacterium]